MRTTLGLRTTLSFACILVFVLVAIGIPLVGIGFDPHKPHSYSVFGAWLQGVLTPGFLLLAAFTFWWQTQSQAEVNKSQAEANKIAVSAVFIDNRERFASYLHYRCVTALVNSAPPAADVIDDNLEGLTAMIIRLSHPDPPNLENLVKGHRLVDLNVMYGSEFYQRLRKSIETIVQMGEQVGLDDLLDGRILKIRKLIQEHPPTAMRSDRTVRE